MSRKAPKPSTVKKLFGLSRNQCASPDCTSSLIESNVVLGEICHIEAAESGGARYNPDSNDEYRRSFDNLILLCEKCHKKIDANEAEFNVALLKSWKRNHETYESASRLTLSSEHQDKLVEKFMQQDNTNSGESVQINNQAQTINVGNQIGSVSIYGNDISPPNLDDARKVITDFKKQIDFKKQRVDPEETAVIDYQDDLQKRHKRPVYLIETKYLRFRKENGRIKADVISYEQMNGRVLSESDENDQKILRDFLAQNDPEKKDVLKRQLQAKGQREPAIITCDGFLINGNRRKMAFEELYQENNQASQFEKMRVVILDEDLTELNLRKIENREQMQDEGKSEYHGLNKALTAMGNIEVGYDLHAQLSDDPEHVGKSKRELDRAVKKFEKDYINPLKCAKRYIEYFDKPDVYNSITSGKGDAEGRWQAFVDYSAFYYGVLDKSEERIKHDISENDIGKIEDVAFKLIRKRDLGPGLGKVHAHLRPKAMKKYLSNPKSKKALFEIVRRVEGDLPSDEKLDRKGNLLPESTIDRKWGARNEGQIVGNLRYAKEVVDGESIKDQPLEYIRAAYRKLTHDNLDIKHIGVADFQEALRTLEDIQTRASQLKEEIKKYEFQLKKLAKKGKEF